MLPVTPPPPLLLLLLGVTYTRPITAVFAGHVTHVHVIVHNGLRLLVALYGARLLAVIAAPPRNKMCMHA